MSCYHIWYRIMVTLTHVLMPMVGRVKRLWKKLEKYVILLLHNITSFYVISDITLHINVIQVFNYYNNNVCVCVASC